MLRIDENEMLDNPNLSAGLVERAYKDMATIHRLLGDERVMIRAIRADSLPVRRVLDVGCGTGLVLQRVGRALGAEVVGVDIRPHLARSAKIPIIEADARCDSLPRADVAFSMYLGHHLAPSDLIRLIRNVGRYCRRFVLLDLIRHPLPLTLFRLFVAPVVCEIDAEDGRRSIRRSYTPQELRDITADALAGSTATFRSRVAPFYLRQVIDISYGPGESSTGLETESAAEEAKCLR